ncbi:MAG TPA: HAD-IA family hydrolase [Limnobacter sp.]|uniref:HAD-IA family hydrolase n=1 Tax=Limnobacter sp. TaxID=2003368 RepID=UPI002E363FB2|nr:HAD-IA family hydrolase [Limnobacter sp.]HEX5487099.1 HAD-IA family hydrolase [Limnobacter sp.]
MAIRAVMFDLDGTLVDTAPDLCGTIQDMQRQRGVEITPLKEMEHLASGGARALLFKGFGLQPTDPEFQAMRQEFLAHYESRIAHESRVYQGVHELLEWLERSGIQWGIVTNKPYYLAELLIKQLNVFHQCSTLVGGDTAPEPKPSPLPCTLAASRIGVSPERCVMIGDDERDVVSGRKAGMQTVAVRYGYIASDIDAWNADHICDHPLDIKTWIALQQ